MTVFQAKQIKASKLKLDPVRLEVLNALRAEGREIRKELQRTTQTWEGAKPTFEIAIGLTQDEASVLVGPGGDRQGAQKWVWLNEGTEGPYKIEPRGNYPLRFPNPGTFSSKTLPGTLDSRAGSPGGPGVVYARSVEHPGIEARNWTEMVAKRRRRRFTRRMIKAKNRGLRKAR